MAEWQEKQLCDTKIGGSGPQKVFLSFEDEKFTFFYVPCNCVLKPIHLK